METIPLEMDDFFDELGDDIVPSRLPDLDDLDLEGGLEPMRDTRYDESNEQGEGDEQPITDNPELLEKLKSLKGASKILTKRSFIKLDATRLTGARGLPILPKIFNDVKLKGKNHEVEDLKTIMHHLEHWAHRLFPKMSFNEVLERTERLGAKKEVQTCVKRIRLGMPVLPTDAADDDDEVQREGGADTQGEGDADVQREDSTVTNSNQLPDEDDQAEMDHMVSQEEDEAQRELESIPKQSVDPVKASLSDEAKERIERNKKLAMERRAERLEKANNANVETTVSSGTLAGQGENMSGSTFSAIEETGVMSNDEQSCRKDTSVENEKEVELGNEHGENDESETLNKHDRGSDHEYDDEMDTLIQNEHSSTNDKDTNSENDKDKYTENDKDTNTENEPEGDIENNEESLIQEVNEPDEVQTYGAETETHKDGNSENDKDKNTENEPEGNIENNEESLIQEVNEPDEVQTYGAETHKDGNSENERKENKVKDSKSNPRSHWDFRKAK